MTQYRTEADAEAFTLLFVCTGNICRSPFAEILCRHMLIGRLGGRTASAFEIESAGLQAVVGAQMHDYTRDELMPWGLDGIIAGRFTSRQLTSALVKEADLVLGVTPQHRTAVIELEAAALDTAFGLLEFARLAASVDPGSLPSSPVPRAHALVREARQRRGLVPPPSPEEDQIPDPVGRMPSAHHDAAMRIRGALQLIVDVLAPPGRRSS